MDLPEKQYRMMLMGGDTRFWYLFGGIWFVVGAGFLLASLGLPNLLGPDAINEGGPPLWVFTLAGLAMLSAGGFVIYRARKLAAHDKRLMESGLSLTATVTDIRESLIKINRQIRWNVCYRYEFNDKTLEGKSRALPGPQVADFKPGQSVNIKLDPTKPEDSLFLGAA
jgi:hypothetical protein